MQGRKGGIVKRAEEKDGEYEEKERKDQDIKTKQQETWRESFFSTLCSPHSLHISLLCEW